MHLNSKYPGRFLGIIVQNPSISKSNWLHVVIFRLIYTSLIYIPSTPLQMIGNYPKDLNVNSTYGSSVTKHTKDDI